MKSSAGLPLVIAICAVGASLTVLTQLTGWLFAPTATGTRCELRSISNGCSGSGDGGCANGRTCQVNPQHFCECMPGSASSTYSTSSRVSTTSVRSASRSSSSACLGCSNPLCREPGYQCYPNGPCGCIILPPVSSPPRSSTRSSSSVRTSSSSRTSTTMSLPSSSVRSYVGF
jgi:hypothetical protein